MAGGVAKDEEATLIVERLSPAVTAAALEAAIQQFGSVVSVEILKNPLDPKEGGLGRAVVRMQTAKDAKAVEMHLRCFLVMIGGVPRPVEVCKDLSALAAENGTGKKTPVVTINNAPDYLELKRLRQKHLRQMENLLQRQRKEEEDLAEEQNLRMSSYYKVLHDMDSNEFMIDMAAMKSLYET